MEEGVQNDKRIDSPLVHLWTIRNAKVVRCQELTDTATEAAALRRAPQREGRSPSEWIDAERRGGWRRGTRDRRRRDAFCRHRAALGFIASSLHARAYRRPQPFLDNRLTANGADVPGRLAVSAAR